MTRPSWVTRVAVVAAALTATAGSCEQDFDERLPPPAELGAAALPPDAVGSGLDAVYALLVRTEGDATQCFHLVRLRPEGAAEFGQGCTAEDVAALAVDEPAWARGTEVGDYGYAAGRMWLRIVAWDPLAEELGVSEHAATYCDRTLDLGGEPRLVEPIYELVVGTPPPDAPHC